MALEVVAALITRGERFLACQRSAHKDRGLLWEFVGGKVEPGESKAQALARECQEELGVVVTVDRPVLEVTHAYPDLTIHLTLFATALTGGRTSASGARRPAVDDPGGGPGLSLLPGRSGDSGPAGPGRPPGKGVSPCA